MNKEERERKAKEHDDWFGPPRCPQCGAVRPEKGNLCDDCARKRGWIP